MTQTQLHHSPSTIHNSQFNPPTLYATVIKLTAAREGSLPATQGRLAQAAFLDIVQAVDPALSAALHAKNQRRPYTISPLQGLPRPRGKQIALPRGQQVWLRVTQLHSRLFTTLTQYFLGRVDLGRLPTIRLGTLDFAVSEMLTTPGSHRWAGFTTLAALLHLWQEASLDKTAQRIRVEFASPTVFSRSSNKDGMGKFMETLPYPAMFFGSVAARWNELVAGSEGQVVEPLAFETKTIREYAEETVVVGQYRLNSQMSRYWGNPQIGVMGTVTYLLKDKANQPLIRALNLLADFAFYSGVGAKTAMGMGMVRRI